MNDMAVTLEVSGDLWLFSGVWQGKTYAAAARALNPREDYTHLLHSAYESVCRTLFVLEKYGPEALLWPDNLPAINAPQYPVYYEGKRIKRLF